SFICLRVTRAGFIRSGNGIRNTLFFIVHSGELSNLSGYESELKSFFFLSDDPHSALLWL
ncbi:hypothetical protein, partial [Klebsiella pneumoniae]|uniref:hypothetical protein n=1 Tax=Klebsiella pneumoniae TaxID=573 RepID=UPI001AD8579A